MGIIAVAPLAGAWIEITSSCVVLLRYCVAPLAGAWIEIMVTLMYFSDFNVAPLAGARMDRLLFYSGNNNNVYMVFT